MPESNTVFPQPVSVPTMARQSADPFLLAVCTNSFLTFEAPLLYQLLNDFKKLFASVYGNRICIIDLPVHHFNR
jgi:hypothetical protein